MYKVLVVGCGGSGQKTVAFMMDQIKADLALYGIEEIPSAWQFVNIDTPIKEEELNKYGIPRVSAQGGHYLATGVAHEGYRVIDDALVEKLSHREGGLRQLATVMPRHREDITVSIEMGAGQMRGLGRLLTVRRLKEIHAVLEKATKSMNSSKALQEARDVCEAVPGLGEPPAADSSPLVFVCSSMAGGTGASMALDVARVLASIPGIDPDQASLFLYTSDVFKNIDAQKSGLAGNTLAFFGEAIASQVQIGSSDAMRPDGAAAARDVALYETMGLPIGKRRPFKTIIPIGSRSYDSEAVNPEVVYRSVGRALARYVDTNALTGFAQYVLANVSTADFLWGVAGSEYGWNSLGYASLSMGRDRYLEYAAQRLSRRAMDRAFEGHREGQEPGMTDKLRLDQLWQMRKDQELRDLGLEAANPRDPFYQSFPDWAIGQLDANAFYAEIRRQLDSQVVPQIPQMGEGVAYDVWFNSVQNALLVQRENVIRTLNDWALAQAGNWAARLSDRLVQVVNRAIADYSVPYALHIVRALRGEGEVMDLVSRLQQHGNAYGGDPTQIPAELGALVGGRGQISQQGLSVQQDKIMEAISSKLYASVGAQVVAMCGSLLKDYLDRVVIPMENALEESMKMMDRDRKEEPVASGVARVQSVIYQTWPFEPGQTDEGHDSVPARFGVADNEITLMKVEEYIPRFESHVTKMMAYENENYTFAQSYQRAVQQVTTGDWPVTGEEKAPQNLVVVNQPWVCAALTGGLTEPRAAFFTVELTSMALLERARQYVLRRGEAFERFASQSLRDYLNEAGVPVSQLEEREKRVAQAMTQAIDMAQPYSAKINQQMFAKVHSGANPGLVLSFSEIPLTDNVRTKVREHLLSLPTLNSQQVAASFDAKCVASDVTKIDIFSSAPTSVPICYTDILEDVRRSWEQAKTHPNARRDFWYMRRTRPLDAVLPVGRDEYEALIRGWFLALAAGALAIPAKEQEDAVPVRIWDFTAVEPGWVDFPHPLLTSPDRFTSNEYLPALLESMLLCYVEAAHTGDDTPFRPYRVLRAYADNGATPHQGAHHTRHDQVVLEQLITQGHFKNLPSEVMGTGQQAQGQAPFGSTPAFGAPAAQPAFGAAHVTSPAAPADPFALQTAPASDPFALGGTAQGFGAAAAPQPVVNVEENRQKLQNYFLTIAQFIQNTYLPGAGKPEGLNAWTNYTTRRLVETTPLNIDISEECIRQLQTLHQIAGEVTTVRHVDVPRF